MPLEMFAKALDFLKRSGIKQARLLGGEPTLHPRFPALVRQAIDRGLDLLIFSNGQMPEAAAQCLADIPEEHCSLLINLTSDARTGGWQADTHQKKVMAALGPRIMAGITIFQAGMALEGLLETIHTYQLRPTVRIGLAQPVLSRSNRYLPAREYRKVGHDLADFAQKASQQGIALEFDCGFVPCMFPAETVEVLRHAATTLGRRCNPVLDVLPDGTVAACYPLAGLGRLPLPRNRSATWLRKKFETRLKVYRSIGLFRDCCVCRWFQDNRCRGGCLAAAMTRLRPTPPERHRRPPVPPRSRDQSTMNRPGRPSPAPDKRSDPEPTKKPCAWVVPYIDQPLEFWQELAATLGAHIREVYFPIPLKGIQSGRPPQTDAHLEDFIRSAPLNASVLINPIVLPGPVERFAAPITETLRRLCDQGPIRGVTVASPDLARHIRRHLPNLELTASVLMEIHTPHQAAMIDDLFDHLVPSGRIMRNREALQRIREAFSGRIRLMVNEACLPGCPYRTQHFYEMANGSGSPQSLCNDLLATKPWLRLTGAWVLPQHLDLYAGLFDHLKLAGRVTLKDPRDYRRVVEAYIRGRPTTPDAIGGGPASVLAPMAIDTDFFAHTLECRHQCHRCDHCREYYRKALPHGR
jgi:hypothetical protein